MLVSTEWSCKQDTQWERQKPIEKVSTETVPIQLQYRGTFDLGEGVYITNKFEGARLNGVARTSDSLITVLITPENAPINMSPWYAFKIWSDTECRIFLKLIYPEHAGHRYLPKLSKDGLTWESVDSVNFQVGEQACKISGLIQDRTGSNFQVYLHFLGNDMGQCGFS